jgi:hypothetical protein
MIMLMPYQLILAILLAIFVQGQDYKLKLQGIEPNAGPDTGETRVLVRFEEIDISIKETYPHPKVIILLI